MLRVIFAATRLISKPLVTNLASRLPLQVIRPQPTRNFISFIGKSSILSNPKLLEISKNLVITRGLIKFSYRKGKRKSVKAVTRRFYRLDWGGWIRTKCGRHKKLWKKTPQRKRRLRQHVLCNSTQSTLLDKMVGEYWRRPKYYVDDPYEPYHTREEYHYTYKKPKPFFPPEQ